MLSADQASRAICRLPHAVIGYYCYPRFYVCARCHVEAPELRYPGYPTAIYAPGPRERSASATCVACRKSFPAVLSESARRYYSARYGGASERRDRTPSPE